MRVITMLLVEDESFERTSLATCVDWDLIGVEIIGEAANGSQGLAKVIELRPDIVLTDVKMPVLDGIEMSRRIRQTAQDVKILFLSSYDDFEYAKQAVDLNVSAYLMKPVNEAELLRTVRRIADEINAERLERRLLNKTRDNLSTSLHLARQALVGRALSDMHIDEQDARSLGLEWMCAPEQRFLIALCAFESGALFPIDAKLLQLTRRVSRVAAHSMGVCVSAGQLVMLCAIGQEDAQEAVARVGQALRGFFDQEGVDVRVAFKGGGNVAEMYAALQSKGVRAPRAAMLAKKSDNKEQIVREIERIINEQYASPLTLESIARTLHFTPNYVGIVFKSATKMSVNRYLLRTRMEKAKLLLGQSGAASLGEIAERCGFGSNTYFHTTFKRETGMTPTEYRRHVMGVKS